MFDPPKEILPTLCRSFLAILRDGTGDRMSFLIWYGLLSIACLRVVICGCCVRCIDASAEVRPIEAQCGVEHFAGRIRERDRNDTFAAQPFYQRQQVVRDADVTPRSRLAAQSELEPDFANVRCVRRFDHV